MRRKTQLTSNHCDWLLRTHPSGNRASNILVRRRRRLSKLFYSPWTGIPHVTLRRISLGPYCRVIATEDGGQPPSGAKQPKPSRSAIPATQPKPSRSPIPGDININGLSPTISLKRLPLVQGPASVTSAKVQKNSFDRLKKLDRAQVVVNSDRSVSVLPPKKPFVLLRGRPTKKKKKLGPAIKSTSSTDDRGTKECRLLSGEPVRESNPSENLSSNTACKTEKCKVPPILSETVNYHSVQKDGERVGGGKRKKSKRGNLPVSEPSSLGTTVRDDTEVPVNSFPLKSAMKNPSDLSRVSSRSSMGHRFSDLRSDVRGSYDETKDISYGNPNWDPSERDRSAWKPRQDTWRTDSLRAAKADRFRSSLVAPSDFRAGSSGRSSAGMGASGDIRSARREERDNDRAFSGDMRSDWDGRISHVEGGWGGRNVDSSRERLNNNDNRFRSSSDSQSYPSDLRPNGDGHRSTGKSRTDVVRTENGVPSKRRKRDVLFSSDGDELCTSHSDRMTDDSEDNVDAGKEGQVKAAGSSCPSQFRHGREKAGPSGDGEYGISDNGANEASFSRDGGRSASFGGELGSNPVENGREGWTGSAVRKHCKKKESWSVDLPYRDKIEEVKQQLRDIHKSRDSVHDRGRPSLADSGGGHRRDSMPALTRQPLTRQPLKMDRHVLRLRRPTLSPAVTLAPRLKGPTEKDGTRLSGDKLSPASFDPRPDHREAQLPKEDHDVHNVPRQEPLEPSTAECHNLEIERTSRLDMGTSKNNMDLDMSSKFGIAERGSDSDRTKSQGLVYDYNSDSDEVDSGGFFRHEERHMLSLDPPKLGPVVRLEPPDLRAPARSGPPDYEMDHVADSEPMFGAGISEPAPEPESEDDEVILESVTTPRALRGSQITSLMTDMMRSDGSSSSSEVPTLDKIYEKLQGVFGLKISRWGRFVAREYSKLTANRPQPVAPTHSEPVQVTVGKYSLTASDLSTLNEDEWLNDNIINAYLHLVAEKAYRTTLAFSSFFLQVYTQKGFEHAQRWQRKSDLFSYHLILIPINSRHHWSMVAADLENATITYFDSMGERGSGYLRKVQSYLDQEAEARGQGPMDWKLAIGDSVPKQRNDSDCGVFLCQYGKRLGFGRHAVFSHAEAAGFRAQMKEELLLRQITPPFN